MVVDQFGCPSQIDMSGQCFGSHHYHHLDAITKNLLSYSISFHLSNRLSVFASSRPPPHPSLSSQLSVSVTDTSRLSSSSSVDDPAASGLSSSSSSPLVRIYTTTISVAHMSSLSPSPKNMTTTVTWSPPRYCTAHILWSIDSRSSIVRHHRLPFVWGHGCLLTIEVTYRL